MTAPSPTKLAKAPTKALFQAMSDNRKSEIAAQFTDDVLSKLAAAFFQVVKQEGWGKRDLSQISGINETAIGHILAGRRKNLTIETIALLTRAMRKRPELTLHDLRPAGNNSARLAGIETIVESAATAGHQGQLQEPDAPSANLATSGGYGRRSNSLAGV